ncbi:Late embryogenesis abundant protein like [Actinidia chinensis var. chinensis]|uniref:Late embryogenesis abundant protein like n=1 Tax=Actinidia chinensis var. chinensis TaxID=1590841 RepID=A0A2R6PNV7_ACTCC|nr:Late embryogenesis abundant protein like [Actinidia chinensis var. chinensis]
MARSFSNAKILSALVADRVSLALSRRGYAAAAASQGVASGSSRGAVTSKGGVMAKKGGEEAGKTSWVPDPVTGYYRPENRAKEIDVAELREILLKNNIRRH